MKSIIPSIEKYTDQLRQEGYSDKDIEYFWHNAFNAFKKRVESEKDRDTKNLTGKQFEQRKTFRIEKDDGTHVTGRWEGQPKGRELLKKDFLQMLEDRVVWWKE